MKAGKLQRPRPARGRIASAREEERRRLARELHDGPAQALAAALFGVDLALTALDRRPAAAREEILTARALVRDALDDVRALMVGLRPRLLEEQGLVAALEAMASSPPLWGSRVTVAAHGLEAGARLPAEVELGLFRIAQEAVSNARRHAAASHVQVSLASGRGSASLRVVDDGRGFRPGQEMGPLTAGRGEGLPGMRERARQLGGTLKIVSAPGAGTRIEVSLPLPERGVGNGVEKGEK
jgi:signal transduction histidine kinase